MVAELGLHPPPLVPHISTRDWFASFPRIPNHDHLYALFFDLFLHNFQFSLLPLQFFIMVQLSSKFLALLAVFSAAGSHLPLSANALAIGVQHDDTSSAIPFNIQSAVDRLDLGDVGDIQVASVPLNVRAGKSVRSGKWMAPSEATKHAARATTKSAGVGARSGAGVSRASRFAARLFNLPLPEQLQLGRLVCIWFLV
jgi:hypothetical protein